MSDDDWHPAQSHWGPEIWRQINRSQLKIPHRLSALGYHGDTEDAAQEAYLKMLQCDGNKANAPIAVTAYVQKVASNAYITELRKQSSERTGGNNKVRFRDAETERAFFNKIESPNVDPTVNLYLENIRTVVKTMPAHFHEVFKRHFEEGNSMEETAELTDKSLAATKTAVFRIREKLRKKGLIPDACSHGAGRGE